MAQSEGYAGAAPKTTAKYRWRGLTRGRGSTARPKRDREASSNSGGGRFGDVRSRYGEKRRASKRVRREQALKSQEKSGGLVEDEVRRRKGASATKGRGCTDRGR